MSSLHLWLRGETKPGERRTAITPTTAKALLDAGYKLSVEECPARVFDIEEYKRVGCDIVKEGSWREAPLDAIIIGLKELPENDDSPLRHTHVFFCHSFKGQAGWREMLARFVRGGGSLYDLEYLTFENGRRVAAFGRAAGMVGGALATALWAHLQDAKEGEPLEKLEGWKNQLEMVAWTKERIGKRTPSAIVMGALGRSGRGATDVMEAVGVKCTKWDLAETKAGGPFEELLNHDILVNCILLLSSIPPFLTAEMMEKKHRELSVLLDVSCDTSNEWNPLPFMNKSTTLDDPVLKLFDANPELKNAAAYGVAIDHLPTLLPREASEGFANDLLPHLLEITKSGVWTRALQVFKDRTKDISKDE